MEILGLHVQSYFTIFDKTFTVYGILYFIGILLSVSVIMILKKRTSLFTYDVVYFLTFVFVGMLIGSKLLFILVSLKQIIKLKLSIIQTMSGGFVFYGGLIGGFLGGLIYCKMFHLESVDFFDLTSVAIPLGHAIGRIGCLTAGCCFGLPWNNRFAVTYTDILGEAPLNTKLFPIQLTESLLLFVLFILLLAIYRSKSAKKGTTYKVYLISYGFIRFSLEFFRGDKIRGLLWGLSTSQWISIFIIIITISLTICHKKSKIQELK